MDSTGTNAISPGIHHVTAIAGDPQRNLNFYSGLIGLRLVKLTVNFDDPTTYHLYYGDGAGKPGTILTFFPWPGAQRGRQGIGQAIPIPQGIQLQRPNTTPVEAMGKVITFPVLGGLHHDYRRIA
jgi:catechol 2,3-dioxygenase-like lactoylglutathione lyase family enzyme